MGKPKTEQNIQDLPPGFYWGKMDVRQCHRCVGKGYLWVDTHPYAAPWSKRAQQCARCNGLGYLYKVVEMEPMGKGHQPEPTVEILPPARTTVRVGYLQTGSYFRCQNGEAAYQVIEQSRDHTAVRMVGKVGSSGEYYYPPDKQVKKLRLRSITLEEEV